MSLKRFKIEIIPRVFSDYTEKKLLIVTRNTLETTQVHEN
jgi:hypothetical protein